MVCPSADQRGISRVGVCDIGAYEFTNPIPPAVSLGVVSGDGQIAPPNTIFPKSLQIVSLDEKGSPLGGILLTFTAPNNGASGTFENGTTQISLPTNDNGYANVKS